MPKLRGTCTIDDCDQPHLSRGWCRKHYYRWQRTGSTDVTPYTPPTCSVDDCETRVKSRGMCGKHYQQWKAHGEVQPDLTPAERFWASVERAGDDECWLWTGSTSNGYGQFRWNGRLMGAHRVAYEITFGSIPDDRQIDHRCHTSDCRLGAKCPHRRCVSPAHLLPVTRIENMAPDRCSAVAANHNRIKTHCAKAHAYTPENTYVTPAGTRYCRTCNREAAARSRLGTRGEPTRQGTRKLTDEQVADIRERYAAGGVRQVDLATEFGITQSQVSGIVRREIRK